MHCTVQCTLDWYDKYIISDKCLSTFRSQLKLEHQTDYIQIYNYCFIISDHIAGANALIEASPNKDIKVYAHCTMEAELNKISKL